MAISRFKTSSVAQGLPKYQKFWDQSTMYYTTAGTTWTAKTLPASGSYFMPVLGGASNNIWMVSAGTAIATSTDNGSTWTARTKNLSGTSIAYGASKWVSCTYTTNTSCVEYSSNDGVTWTTGTMPNAWNWDSLLFAQGRFIALAYGDYRCATSTDGVTWTTLSMPVQTNNRRSSITYSAGLGMWIATSRDASCFDSSPDGLTWTARTGPSIGDWYATASNSGIFVAGKYNTTSYATSTDGTTWTGRTFAVTLGSTAGAEAQFGTMAMNAFPPSSNIYTSTNGTTWTARTLPSSQSWNQPSKNQQTTSNVMMVQASGTNTIAVSLY